MLLPSRCVLVLEDEPFIAVDVEEILAEAGIQPSITFDSTADAKDWLNDNSPRFAIIDPRLKDGLCSSVAATMVARKIPFLVHSGDSQSTMEPGSPFTHGMWISKPSLPEDLLKAAYAVLGSTG
jgi:DNA-binding response OmpR family regulator